GRASRGLAEAVHAATRRPGRREWRGPGWELRVAGAGRRSGARGGASVGADPVWSRSGRPFADRPWGNAERNDSTTRGRGARGEGREGREAQEGRGARGRAGAECRRRPRRL